MKEGDEYATLPPLSGDRHPSANHRCQICDRTLAYRPGTISQALTEHYRRVHREALGVPAA